MRETARKDRGERGLTLLEVLMGVVILGIAIAPVLLLLSGAFQSSSLRAEESRTLYLAQGKMEELLALGYDDLTPGTSLSDWVAVPDSIYRQVTITVNPDAAFDSNMKLVTVSVGETSLSTLRASAFDP